MASIESVRIVLIASVDRSVVTEPVVPCRPDVSLAPRRPDRVRRKAGAHSRTADPRPGADARARAGRKTLGPAATGTAARSRALSARVEEGRGRPDDPLLDRGDRSRSRRG